MSNLSVFNFESHTIRSVMIGGEPWFVGKDVAETLGYSDTVNALKQHAKGVVKHHPLQTAGGMQELRVLSEPDVLRLIVGSKLPAAQAFETWVFEEVLPSIRKTGKYTAPTAKQPPLLPLAEEAVRVASAISDCLHLEGSGRLAMLEKCIALKAPSYLPVLPAYAIDAPRTTDGKLISSGEGSSLTCAPVSDLLKKFSVGSSPASFNKLLLSEGFLEVLERKSTSQPGAVRSYKAVSAKGLAYGKNLVNPKAQGETQPYWFHSTFPRLLKELNVQL